MLFTYYQRSSLKAKIALWAMLAMAVVVVSGTSLALLVVHGDMRRTASDSQSALVDSIAANLDAKIDDRRAALALTAGVLGPMELRDPAALHAHFASRPLALGLFDVIFTTDRSGTLVFDTPVFPGRVGRSVADRDYFKDVMASGRSVVSLPLAGKATSEPNIVFASPLRNRAGEITGVMGGVVYLSRPNFLSALGSLRIGKAGYVAVLAKGEQPMIVMHAHRERIMSAVPPPERNSHVHQALRGFEGTVEAVNSVGLEALFSYRSLRSVPWVVTTAYPTAEAYAQLEGTQRNIVLIALLLMLSGGAGIWLLTRQLLAPLDRLRQAMVDARGHAEPMQVDIHDETRELREVAQAYNDLMRHTQDVSLRQARSEERVVRILAHAPDAFISIDPAGFITEWNRQAELTFGWQRAEVLGRDLAEVVIPPDMRAGHNAGMARFRGTGEGPVVNRRIEVTAVRKDGTHIPVELSVAMVQDGEGFAANAFLRDISERKAAEQLLAASEKRLRDITNNLPAHIGYFDRDERCHFANDTALRTLNMRREDLNTYTLRSAVGDHSYAQQEPSAKAALTGQRCSMEGSVMHNGRELHFQAHFVPDFDDAGEVRGFYAMTFDITALKRAEQARAEGEQRLRTIADNLPVLISYVDNNERVQFANETYREWLGLDPQASVGRTFVELVGPQLYEQRREQLQLALGGQRVSFEVESVMVGVTRNLHNVYVPDVRADGRVAGLYTLSSDVTALKQVEKQLSELARVDSLTTLPNRRAFDERLPDAVARSRRSGRPMALMFLDVDHFKQINDTHGHAVGDGVLKEFARRLQACVRATDTVARFAGDEFVVILEGIKTSEEAAMLARKIGEAVRVPFMLSNELMLQVTSSVGVAYLETEEVSPSDVVAKADSALYEAKRAGRNTYALSRW